MQVIIVGAGAAGCFAAIEIKRQNPHLKVTVLEAGARALAKVMVTGGGRCNLTNSFAQVDSLERVYPRGHRLMKRLFHVFSPQDTQAWWEREGVALVTQDDECIFPQSQRASQVVDTLLALMRREGVELMTRARVEALTPQAEGFLLRLADGRELWADRVLLTTGGVQTQSHEALLRQCPLPLEAPLPSLFSLVIPRHPITELMGLVVPDAVASLPGTKFKAQGPLLITHWGVSGPAILKLSSYAARWLAEHDYKATLAVNWMQGADEEAVRTELSQLRAMHPAKLVGSAHPAHLQGRLWALLCKMAAVPEEMRWSELSGKVLNRLVSTLTNSQLPIEGKNRFKEEFVTAGGVRLSEINANTLESKTHPGLFLAGEVLDVDAITGGFNLQAAWTMGYVAAQHIANVTK